MVGVIVTKQEVPEVIRQFQAHEIVLKHEQIKREVLNAIIDIPGVTDVVLNTRLLFNEQLIAFDRSAGNKQDMCVLSVLRHLKEELIDEHLDRLKLRPYYVHLCD